MQFTRKKITAVVATTAVVALGAGVAVAYWTSVGDGVGQGTTGTSTAFVVTSAAAAGPPLLPGVGAQTVEFTVTNPAGAGQQKLNLVTVAVAGPAGAVWDAVPDCAAADYTVSVTTPPAYTDMAPGSTRVGTATLSMINRAAVQDGCKLADVPLWFHAS